MKMIQKQKKMIDFVLKLSVHVYGLYGFDFVVSIHHQLVTPSSPILLLYIL